MKIGSNGEILGKYIFLWMRLITAPVRLTVTEPLYRNFAENLVRGLLTLPRDP